ncbi:hypothetical protein [Porphyrobacter sp. AAP82]|uniref:hypothetical protein n=1 Tax=Porphyrobacter sp. AAP82 TaxID=1248917 RepID=UPI001F29868F|nr:hypothetical protein [Porphyrobacter sp. AAP82]
MIDLVAQHMTRVLYFDLGRYLIAAGGAVAAAPRVSRVCREPEDPARAPALAQ